GRPLRDDCSVAVCSQALSFSRSSTKHQLRESSAQIKQFTKRVLSSTHMAGRHEYPIHMLGGSEAPGRRVSVKMQLNGTDLKAGNFVVAGFGTANRNPRRFALPPCPTYSGLTGLARRT
ncbi:MAG: hypothetical protein IIZ92_27060, partial [Aquincola sp.]|nr:hypothetical protein [Aquincola sp.]